jgi:hypothetical protein
MKAPSEKHLEDWIVVNADYMINEIGLYDKIIGRQVQLPAGICDLITTETMYGVMSVSVVEIKKDAVDSKALAQCLRYMRDLGQIFCDTKYPISDTDDFMRWNYTPVGTCEMAVGHPREVVGTLLGYDVPDKNILIACEAIGVRVMTYDFDGTDYDFNFHHANEPMARYEMFRDFSRGAVGDAMRDVIKNRFMREVDWKRERDGRLT